LVPILRASSGVDRAVCPAAQRTNTMPGHDLPPGEDLQHPRPGAGPTRPIPYDVPSAGKGDSTGDVLKFLGGVMVAASFVLFSFVGIPETTTITADGISTTISWGHVILYGALGLVGALVFWAGSADH
jgi:hypothetical protein